MASNAPSEPDPGSISFFRLDGSTSYANARAAFPASTFPRSPAVTALPGSRSAKHDPRWPALVAALRVLRGSGRRSVRIVDADCGTGALLVHAACHARSLGFTAIEARGIEGSPALIGRAWALAAGLHDSTIGLTYELADLATALAEEAEQPADIVLWHRATNARHCPGIERLIERAGDVVIGDLGVMHRRRSAA